MAERTEAPTPQRIQEARREGRVAKSTELNAAIALLVAAFLLRAPGSGLLDALKDVMTTAIIDLPNVTGGQVAPSEMLFNTGMQLGPSIAILILGLLATGVAVSLGQTGFLWASKQIKVDFDRINALKGFQRLLSLNGLVELVKAVFKLAVILWVAYNYLEPRVHELIVLGQMDFGAALGHWAELAYSLILRVGGAYLVLAAADYGYQRWQWMRSMRMTKQEIREEAKQREGDPMLRQRIRGQQRQFAMQRMMAELPKADVVITNPTHLAVAIRYTSEDMGAPKVIAKGARNIAKRIKEEARKLDIPVVENKPVAQALYKAVEVNQEIPPDMYIALAEILAYVYNLRKVRSVRA
ncbi:MAG: flagellar biosynthesis protein FlhB [Chloroflexi bacterium]|nr:MAG: flagellar biosynthesis protein FlhB [Chloroflexota bacterium]MBL1194818.1 flagellar biosynthesis protein FlhB [Chloroflexota bacterium]NOH12109.1 flagellar biosynthesis protein FlhB [Chloroflexota bacterium]